MKWHVLDTSAPRKLASARSHAHWAAQVVAAVGETHAAHVPDTSHTAMEFDPVGARLLGTPLDTPDGSLRAAFSVERLTLQLIDPNGEPLASRALAGATLDDALQWMGETLESHSRGSFPAGLMRPDYPIPLHPLASGARFESDGPALAELAGWFSNAHTALMGLTTREERTPILCWPHHFDLATLLVVERSPSGEMTKTIGVGLSPGDDSIDEPYWYVNHWPAHSERGSPLAELPLGRWHTEGSTSAALSGSELTSRADATHQQTAVQRFLEAAIQANREVLS